MRKIYILLLVLSSTLLSGCDNAKEYMKCRLVASALGDYEAVKVIDKKFSEKGLDSELPKNTQDIADLIYELRDDLGLLSINRSKMQEFKLIKTYNSCTDIHGQEKFSVPGFMYYFAYPFL